MAEWSKAAVLKTVVGLRPPWVRIPPPPQIETSARLADLSLSTVVKVADGTNQNPTIDTLKKIAKALEIGVDDLIKK